MGIPFSRPVINYRFRVTSEVVSALYFSQGQKKAQPPPPSPLKGEGEIVCSGYELE